MKYLILVNHGSGAEFMQVSYLREFSKIHSKDKVYISALNKYFADALANELENVYSIDRNDLYSTFVNIMQHKGDWKVIQPEVYHQYEFFSRQSNYYEELAKLLDIPYIKDYEPYLRVSKSIEEAAKNFSKEHKHFIIFQRKGGINPLASKEDRLKLVNQVEKGLIRSYPLKQSIELVKRLSEKGYEVLQYCLPEEEHIPGCIYLKEEINQLFYHELSKYAEAVITIDSSLMHLSVKHSKKLIVLWAQSASGENNCIGFGYKKAKNLFSDFIPTVPYFNGLPESPIFEPVRVDDVIGALDEKD